MKKIILLILPAFLFAGCSVKDKEKEINVFQNTVTSVYTGKVKHKLPEGEGSALIDSNASVEGLFEQGTFISGTATGVPYSIAYNDQTVSGVYSGEVSDRMPSGSGTFEADTFTYNGTWTGGIPEGTGTVQAETFLIDTPAGILEGSYDGEVSGLLAEGNGTFTYLDGSEEIVMTGSFSGNMFDGQVVRTTRYQDTEKSYPVYYEDGEAEDTAVAMIAYLEGMRNESYCLSEAQSSFIKKHSALFEGTGNDVPKEYSSSFDYDTFKEDDDPELILIRGAVIKSVQRYKPYNGSDTVTSMIVYNNDGWYHLVFAWSVNRADQGDIVDIYALPLCRSTLTAPEQDYPAIDAAGAVMIGG